MTAKAKRRYLLDSVILIDHFNGEEAATHFIAKHAEKLAISAITRAEVLVGFGAKDLPEAVLLLDSFTFLPMDKAVADEAARIRQKTGLKLPDAIQAAFAACHGMKLVTRNTKDFKAGKFPFVLVPYSLS